MANLDNTFDALEALKTPELPLQAAEDVATRERFDRRTARTEQNMGAGDTDVGLALTERHLTAVTDGFIAAMADRPESRRHPHWQVLKAVQPIEPAMMALATLSRTLSCIAKGEATVATMKGVSAALYSEVWAVAFREFDEKAAAATETSVRRTFGTLEQRTAAARRFASKAGFGLAQWDRELALQVGAWAVGVLLSSAPDLFTLDNGGTAHGDAAFITLTDGAWEIAEQTVQAVLRRYPVFLPSATPPEPWTSFTQGGPTSGQLRGTLMRSYRRDLPAVVNAAIKSGQMKPALDALHAAQSTAWTINGRVLDVLRAVVARDLKVSGIPQKDPVPKPPLPQDLPFEDLTELEQKQWRIKAGQVKATNRALAGDRIGLVEDLRSAEALENLDAFYTPCSLDWRGRVYPMPSFNFQRSDRVRGLFLFANGEPIGERGLWWLKVHVANCGDFGKVSKAAFEDRVRWIDEHMHVLRMIDQDPLSEEALRFWPQADKPFLFLAGVFELIDALDEGPGFITHLPCSWDGSCSGLQHLAAMTRADEGALVNLVPTPRPQDVYQTVAERTAVKVAADLTSEELYPPINEARKEREDEGERKVRKPLSHYARLLLGFGVNRKLVKRNVMTYSYSSGKFGMSEQHREDTMRPLKTQVLLGDITEHPFGEDNGYTAAKYIAERVHSTIEEIVERPAQAMRFLQKLAKTAAHEGKCVTWITPAGLPWENRYRVPVTKRITLWMHDQGARVQFRPLVMAGDTAEVDKRKVAAAIAPNFVHALDAAHLLLTVNASVAEGIVSFGLVHDSFGCLASRSEDMHRIIRETFVRMYEEHDVLGEVLEQTRAALSPDAGDKLPEPVIPGNLNLKDVLDARYAFA